MDSLRKRLVVLGTVVFLSGAVVAGCGGDSQPAYCDRVSELRDSVTALTDISINSDILDSVQTDLDSVQANANAVVDAAREDFPEETDELETTVNNASDSIEELPSSPSAADIAALAIEIGAVGNAASNLFDATSSACE